jgi:hypothetical protein
MSDLSKSDTFYARQALEEELARAAPLFDLRLDKAEELLADFSPSSKTTRRSAAGFSQPRSIESGRTAARSSR